MQFASEIRPHRRALLIALAAVGTAAAVPTTYALLTPDAPAPSPRLHLTDELREYVGHFPRDGGYRTPTRSERTAVAEALTGTLRGSRSIAAQHLLRQIDYRLT